MSNWETIEVVSATRVKMRARIKILDYQAMYDKLGHKGEEAWMYCDGSHRWVECGDGTTLKLMEEEYEFVD